MTRFEVHDGTGLIAIVRRTRHNHFGARPTEISDNRGRALIIAETDATAFATAAAVRGVFGYARTAPRGA
jgi:hypothetical protein